LLIETLVIQQEEFTREEGLEGCPPEGSSVTVRPLTLYAFSLV
tara:strand:+ start:713 stop:841 length:129 start_codon:yes stop_codon:yes gene_type:complete